MLDVQNLDGSQVLMLKLQDQLTQDDFKKWAGLLDEVVAKHGKASVLMDLSAYSDPETYKTILDFMKVYGESLNIAEIAQYKLKHLQDFKRVALVSIPVKGLEQWAALAQALTNAEVKYFKPEERDQAMTWVQAA